MDNLIPEEESLFEKEELMDREISIKMLGIGGAGSNAIDRLKLGNLDRVGMTVVNTDSQALAASPVEEKILIGSALTRGLGAGGDPELGRLAAEAERDVIAEALRDVDLVFLVAGMGGGTGSGAAPVVAELASQSGALVIAFVTMPFTFEGGRRLKQADEGLIALRAVCDAVIPLPNDILLQQSDENSSVLNAFAKADEWIDHAVTSIWSMLFKTGLINIDFAALRQVFAHKSGKTLFGIGRGEGENATGQAIENLKMCPLLHTPEFSRKADRLLVNIVGGPNLSLTEVNEIMSAIAEDFGRDPYIVMGAVIDEDLAGQVEICVIGTTNINARGGYNQGDVAKVVRVSRKGRIIPKGKKTVLSEKEKKTPVKEEEAQSIPISLAFDQDEFAFGEADKRGHFDHTERNLFEGQDIDLPTYLRKGIKISL
ncbi:MAG: cell division protein FtsZ [Opitutaceae bacterium]|nr:cell division protein FtsZ [Opitutaceae bacterium]